MSELKVELTHGLKLGESLLKWAVIREVTAGDMIEAQEEAEKLVMVPDGNGGVQPQFVPSPSMMGIHILRRQIKAIDDVSGPFPLDQIKKLHPDDLNQLMQEANKLDAVAEQVAGDLTKRGRSDRSGENA